MQLEFERKTNLFFPSLFRLFLDFLLGSLLLVLVLVIL